MTLAVEFMLKRTKLLGKPYMECSEDPESNHCYQLQVFMRFILYGLHHMDHNAYDTDIPFFVDVLEKTHCEAVVRNLLKIEYEKAVNAIMVKFTMKGQTRKKLMAITILAIYGTFRAKILKILAVQYY